MNSGLNCDEDLLRRLPLPLAQLYRRAQNAKSVLESHLAAFYLWEAGLRLLATVALVEHAGEVPQGPLSEDQQNDLHNLARPALGHWWKFVKILLPRLANQRDERFRATNELLLGRDRHDMPRAAGLEAVLLQMFHGKGGALATVKLAELFDHLVQLRNEEMGHGAVGGRPREFYARISPALLAGVAEVFSRIDVRTGRRLIYVADIHRQPSGGWSIERYELVGESPRRLESQEVPEAATAQLPRPSRVYLEIAPAIDASHGRRENSADAPRERKWCEFQSLHPLLTYDPESNQARFFNAFDRKGQRLAYLCYTTSEISKEPDLENDFRRLLDRILGQAVESEQVEKWANQAAADDPATAVASNSGLRQIGEFELLSKLGWGGMGVVYRARQPTLGREVALKLMRQIGNPRAESRFAREIRALGHVEHPNLVKVFTSGADGDRWFYTMELVEGTTLEAVQTKLTAAGSRAGELDLNTWKETLGSACSDTCKSEEPVSGNGSGSRPPQPTKQSPTEQSPAPAATSTVAAIAPAPKDRSYLRQMSELLRQVADAAHALHEKGVVHRDIKPGNIMVTDDGNRAVLMDLGLAQLTDEVEGNLTRTREFLGTPRYASPEQVMAARRVDRRSDIYSLGATLWELLTLRPMYGATDETPFGEVAQRIQVREPERVRKYNPRVRRDLDAIVLKCLEKDPDRRYATARELAEDLQRFLHDEPVAARPVGETERAWRWCKRNPVVSGLLAAFVVVLAAGLAGVTWKWRDAETNLSRAVAAERKAAEAADNARREAANARDSQQVAEQQRRHAEESRYAADMSLAQDAADRGNFGRAVSLLNLYRPNPRSPNLREFAWRHLCWLCEGDSVATFHDHADQVLSAAFSPDGRILATACLDGTVLLHDPADLDREPFRLPSLEQTVQAVEFSPDGHILACATGNPRSAVDDCQVHLWDIAAKKFVAVLEDPTKLKLINALAYSSDGTRLATASEDNQVRVWKLDPSGNQLIARMPGYSRGANDVSFAPGSHLLAIGWGNGRLEVWDVDANKQRVGQSVHVSGIIALAFSPNGQSIVVASRDGPVFYWDMKANQLSEPMESGQGIVESIRFSSDGAQFVTGGSNGTVVLWEFAGRQPVHRFFGHRDEVLSVAFAPHGSLFASASFDHTVKLWDATARHDTPSLPHQGVVQGLAFSADGKLLVTAEGRSASTGIRHPGNIYLWNMESSPPKATTLTSHNGDVNSVAISRDGSLLASGSDDHTAIIWDTVAKKPLATLPEQSGVTAVRFAASASGPLLATGTEQGAVKLWSPAAGGEWAPTDLGSPHKRGITSVPFSPDGSLLASSSSDGTVCLWDVAKRSLISVLEGHRGQCYAAEFSPDGAMLASGGYDRTVRIWDLKGRKFHKEDATVLLGYNAPITSLAFSPDGKTLAGGNRDSSVTLWSVDSLKQLAVFPAHRGGVLCSAFSPDGTMLATGGTDQTVKLWQTIKSPDASELFGKQFGWSRP